MTHRTNVFLFVAGGVLAVGLVTGLVASYVGLPGAGFADTNPPVELRYLPEDVVVVAYANVRDLMDSPVRKRLRAARPHGSRAQRFRDSTGIDVETDIDVAIMGLTPTGADGPEIQLPLTVIRGRFDAGRIEEVGVAHGGVAGTYNGRRVLTMPGAGGLSVTVGVLGPDLAAVGPEALVQRSIELAGGGSNATDNGAIMALVRDVSAGTTWAVGRLDQWQPDDGRIPPMGGRLPPVSSFSVSAQVRNDVRTVGRVEARDESGAESLTQVAQGLIALARLGGGRHPSLEAVMSTLQLRAQGRTLSVEFLLSEEAIDTLLSGAGPFSSAVPDTPGQAQP